MMYIFIMSHHGQITTNSRKSFSNFCRDINVMPGSGEQAAPSFFFCCCCTFLTDDHNFVFEDSTTSWASQVGFVF